MTSCMTCDNTDIGEPNPLFLCKTRHGDIGTAE